MSNPWSIAQCYSKIKFPRISKLDCIYSCNYKLIELLIIDILSSYSLLILKIFSSLIYVCPISWYQITSSSSSLWYCRGSDISRRKDDRRRENAYYGRLVTELWSKSRRHSQLQYMMKWFFPLFFHVRLRVDVEVVLSAFFYISLT